MALVTARLNDGSVFPYGFGLDLDEISGTPVVFHAFQHWDAQGSIPPIDVTHAIVASLDPVLVRSDRAPQNDPNPKLTANLVAILRAKDRTRLPFASSAFAHLAVPGGLLKGLQYVDAFGSARIGS